MRSSHEPHCEGVVERFIALMSLGLACSLTFSRGSLVYLALELAGVRWWFVGGLAFVAVALIYATYTPNRQLRLLLDTVLIFVWTVFVVVTLPVGRYAPSILMALVIIPYLGMEIGKYLHDNRNR